jgi:hypothetical protein
MDSADDSAKLRTQALVRASLISGAGLLIGLGDFLSGQARAGVLYYPLLAVAVVVWLYGQAQLVTTVTRFAREQRERQEGGN